MTTGILDVATGLKSVQEVFLLAGFNFLYVLFVSIKLYKFETQNYKFMLRLRSNLM